ncbi:MAG: hypothetical protein WCO68_06020 [Verrucomicrobiota bacterium]
MASTFTRKDSKFIWLRFKNEKDDWDQRSLGLRKDSAADRRKASEIEAEHTLKERQRSPGSSSCEDFDAWVIPWLELKYESRESTLKR